jgi:replicative DNA helicase
MSLLGTMLLDRDSIGLVLQIIPRDESTRFYRPDHRILFETLIDLYDTNKPIDIIILEDELRRRDQLQEIGGRDYLLDLVNSVPSAANSEHYARIVRDKSMLRDLIQSTGQVMQAAYDQREPATEILDEAERQLFAVTEQRITRQATSIREVLAEAMRYLDAASGQMTGLPTGFTELDFLLGGLQQGDFIVIAGRPSMGKTALGLSLLEYIGIVEKNPAAFFSLEMGRHQIAQRMLCSHAQIDMHRLRHGKLSKREMTTLKLVAGNMQNFPIFIDDTPGMSIMELRAKARRLKMLHDIKVVFLDYMQLMYDRAGGRESRQQEISAISRGLKALGRELEIPIVAMAQLNRQVEGRPSKRPLMSDLRESGAIEQDADVVILMHREEYYLDKKLREEGSEEFQRVQGKAELIVDKQRNGPTGVVTLHFNPQFARFDNAASTLVQGDEDYAGGSGDYSYDPGISPEGPPTLAPEEDEAAPF